MQPKILSSQILLIVILTGFALLLALLVGLAPESYNLSARPIDRQTRGDQAWFDDITLSRQEQASPGLPVHLEIPKINVNAPILEVGLTPNGTMDVPKGPLDVAWFNLGPRPGEIGSAVISGHYGPWKNGMGSVFDNLNKLRKGDKLYIKDEKGVTTTFVVRESRSYDPNADSSDVFGSSDGIAHLNLVTCSGDWIASEKTYTNRLVVFTDKVPSGGIELPSLP